MITARDGTKINIRYIKAIRIVEHYFVAMQQQRYFLEVFTKERRFVLSRHKTLFDAIKAQVRVKSGIRQLSKLGGE